VAVAFAEQAYGDLVETCRANPWAAPALTPDRRIDDVLAGRPRRGGRGHVVGARRAGVEPVGGVVASDHHAVVADVRY